MISVRMNLQRSHQIPRQGSAMNGKGLVKEVSVITGGVFHLRALSTKGRYFSRMFGNGVIVGQT